MSGGDFLFTNPAKVVYSSHVQRVATRIPDRAQNIHNNENNNKDPTDKSIQRSRSFGQREKRKTTKKKEPKKKIKKEKPCLAMPINSHAKSSEARQGEAI